LAFTINLFILCDKALLIPTDGNRLSSLYGQQFKSGSWRPQKRHLLPIDANCWLVYLQDTLAAHTSSVVVCPHFVSLFLPPPLLLLVRTLGGQFVNANNADRLRSRTAAN